MQLMVLAEESWSPFRHHVLDQETLCLKGRALLGSFAKDINFAAFCHLKGDEDMVWVICGFDIVAARLANHLEVSMFSLTLGALRGWRVQVFYKNTFFYLFLQPQS